MIIIIRSEFCKADDIENNICHTIPTLPSNINRMLLNVFMTLIEDEKLSSLLWQLKTYNERGLYYNEDKYFRL